jgi:hypothetical protein
MVSVSVRALVTEMALDIWRGIEQGDREGRDLIPVAKLRRAMGGASFGFPRPLQIHELGNNDLLVVVITAVILFLWQPRGSSCGP